MLGLVLMSLTMLSHYFLNDPLSSYSIPFMMAMGCLYVIRLSLIKVKPIEKKL